MSAASLTLVLIQWTAREGIAVGVGARDALEAKLIENAGFDFVWASGFDISASYAVPDANLISMKQYLEAARSMNEGPGFYSCCA